MAASPGEWSIGEVLELLHDQFPEVSVSKIRFLETRGLVHPARSPGGYRKFTRADVGRLRWILHHQREHYLPLRVIADRLAGLDDDDVVRWGPGEGGEFAAVPVEGIVGDDLEGGRSPGEGVDPGDRSTGPSDDVGLGEGNGPGWAPLAEAAPSSEAFRVPGARDGPDGDAGDADRGNGDGGADAAGDGAEAHDDGLGRRSGPERDGEVASVGLLRRVGEAVLRLRDLAILSGLEEDVVAELDGYGLLPRRRSTPDVLFGEEALVVARLAGEFARYGVEPRHLRMYKTFAEREAAFFEQLVPLARRSRQEEERRRVREVLADLARLGEELRTSALRSALSQVLEE